jgi:citrate lyase subunit beta / citryl-CoA lyase
VNRNYPYAPGHDPARLAAAFEHGADAVVLDLEDGVPPERRDEARANVAELLRARGAWVRVNPAGTPDAEADLEAVGRLPIGIRLPKTRSPDEARWLIERSPGVMVICSIESGQGLAASPAIAAVPGVSTLSIGSRDLTRRPRLRGQRPGSPARPRAARRRVSCRGDRRAGRQRVLRRREFGWAT